MTKKGGAARVTAQDISRAGGMAALVDAAIKGATSGSEETMEASAARLAGLAEQNHNAHAQALFAAGAVPALVHVLARGNAAAQSFAAKALHCIASGSEEHQRAVVEAGGVEPLVRLLKAGSAKVQEDVASALASISTDAEHQRLIIEAGCIVPLVAILGTGSASAQAHAAQTLANAAACGTASQDATVKAGGVPLLIALLSVGKAAEPAAGCLARLAANNAANQVAISDAGAVAPLIALLNGRNAEAQVTAAAALSELCHGNADAQSAVARAGGIAPLLALLVARSSAPYSQAMTALAHLAHSNRENQEAIARLGGIKHIVQLLDAPNSTTSVQAAAALALMEVSSGNPPNAQKVVEHGAIDSLASLLKNTLTALTVKAEVAGSLCALSEPRENKVMVAQTGTIPALVALLGMSGDDAIVTRAKEHAEAALLSLANDTEDNQVQITRLLVDLLTTTMAEATSMDILERAVRVSWVLVQQNPSAHGTIANAAESGDLVQLLTSGEGNAKDYALWALSQSISAANQAVVLESGGIAALVRFLSDARPVILEQAAAALTKVSRDNMEATLAIANAGGVKPLLRLIESQTDDARATPSSTAGLSNHSRSLAEVVLTAGDERGQTDNVVTNAVDALANLAVEASARDEILALGGIQPLVSLLKGSSSIAKACVASALARLSKDHEATQLAVAEAGAIEPLVVLTGGNDGAEAQEAAAGALSALASCDSNRMIIATSGDGVGRLVNLLACDNPRARQHAENALVRLSIENKIRSLMIRKMVDMVSGEKGEHGEQKHNELQGAEQAAAALANLAKESEENRHSIVVEAKGIPPLLALLDSQSAKAKENSVCAITDLCHNSAESQAALARAGGIPKLVSVLLGYNVISNKDAGLVRLYTLAASAITELVKGNRRNQEAAAAAGAIPPLVGMLSCSTAPQMQANAAGALANLARGHTDNQSNIARAGAIGPFCTLVREGTDEARVRSASAMWALASEDQSNKETIYKLGGIDALLGLLVASDTPRTQKCVAGALCALSAKHSDNRGLISKRIIGLLTSAVSKGIEDRVVGVLMTCSTFAADATANQVTLAKGGAIAPILTWLESKDAEVQAMAARAALSICADNLTTQTLVTKAGGAPPLIGLVRTSPRVTDHALASAQTYAAQALWHLASQHDNQAVVIDNGGIKPIVSMLSADSMDRCELAATLLCRIIRMTPAVAVSCAEKGAIPSLVSLLTKSTPGAQQWATAALAELAKVPQNRDSISDAKGIPLLISLLDSATVGTPETAARVISHLALDDDDASSADGQSVGSPQQQTAEKKAPSKSGNEGSRGCHHRRAMIHSAGGVTRLIQLLEKDHLPGAGSSSPGQAQVTALKGLGSSLAAELLEAGLQEQVAAALADITLGSATMQEAVIKASGVPSLLAFLRWSSALGQEHAARAVRNLCFRADDGTDVQMIANQKALVHNGAITELVQLTKSGSNKAQELAAAALSELACGAIVERDTKNQMKFKSSVDAHAIFAKYDEDNSGGIDSDELCTALEEIGLVVDLSDAKNILAANDSQHVGTLNVEQFLEIVSALSTQPGQQQADTADDDDDETIERLVRIAEAGGIAPLVSIISSSNSNSQARESAAGALMHLALDLQNQIAIAAAHGIQPLVSLLDTGTAKAHMHASAALLRIAVVSEETQLQTAKNLVALLSTPNPGAQRRASRVLSDLAASNSRSPVIIVNAGGISPLVNLVCNGSERVKIEAAGALRNLSLNSPSTQLAIATGLVNLLGTSSAETQEHVSKLVLTLCQDDVNRGAVAKAGAVRGLVAQIRDRASEKAQALSLAALSNLSDASDANVDAIAKENGIRPLCVVLQSSHSTTAQSDAAAVVAHLARRSTQNKMAILAEDGIALFVRLLAKKNLPTTKAEAAHTLKWLASGQPDTQKAIAESGAIPHLVALLDETDGHALRRAASAIAELASDSVMVQDAVERESGIAKLVGLLRMDGGGEEVVQAEAANALAVLSGGNKRNQEKVTQAGGVAPLVAMLHDHSDDTKEAAAAALWALAANNHANQTEIADAGGIAPLVSALGSGSASAEEQAGGALAALALDHTRNQEAVASLVVSLLGSDDKHASAKAALAISSFADASGSNQRAIAAASGLERLVEQLNKATRSVANKPVKSAHDPPSTNESTQHKQNPDVIIQAEVAGALWSMAKGSPENQRAVTKLGGVPPLIHLLTGHADTHRDAAGALWALAADDDNKVTIADSGGIQPLVNLLKGGSRGVNETVAGALHALASTPKNRVAIANAGGITLLTALLDVADGTEESKDQAAGALQSLCQSNAANQIAIAQGLVQMLADASPQTGQQRQGHVTALIRNLALEPENRPALTRAGAVPELVRVLELGSEETMGLAASGLALIAKRSAEYREIVREQLVKKLASKTEAVRQRASEALREIAEDDSDTKGGSKKAAARAGSGRPLVSLLKEGLKDGRVEAQEYALRSLSSITDAASKADIIEAGVIPLLMKALTSGQLSADAQLSAAAVLRGVSSENAAALREANAIGPLVHLLLSGSTIEAKEHAAVAIAHIASHASPDAPRSAAQEIAEAGGVSGLISWLADSSQGPPDVAAHALGEIARNNPDMQTQIAEEGALVSLVSMVRAWSALVSDAASSTTRSRAETRAHTLATVAAGCLATLAKDNVTVQIMVSEEGGVPPLLTLLRARDRVPMSHENATRALWHLAEYEDNRIAIAGAGGLAPIVHLLAHGNEVTQQYAAAAVESLAREQADNQIQLARNGAIDPLIQLLGSDLHETQQHSVGALLHLAANDDSARNAVVKKLVGVLEQRNAAAQMAATTALAVLATKSAANRSAITSAQAVAPLCALLGDGRRVRAGTPQERAAVCLADLSRMGENKTKVVAAGAVPPLCAMLSAESKEAQEAASSTLCQLAAVRSNQAMIAEGGTTQLVQLLTAGSVGARKNAAGALWHLASSADSKAAMVHAGAISPLVAGLHSDVADLREHSAAVLSALACTQGGHKRAIVEAGGITPLVALLSDPKPMAQRHAACALWGLSDGKDGIYDKQIAEAGAIPSLIGMLQYDDPELRGYATACLKCCCADENAKMIILSVGGDSTLIALINSPSAWLRTQATEMLRLLGIPFHEPAVPSPRAIMPFSSRGSATSGLSSQYEQVITQAVLRVRKTPDPNSEVVKSGLAINSVVSVIERMRLEDQTERALIQLPNEPKPLGWVTLSKPDGKQNAIVKRGSQLRDTVDGPTAGGMSARRRRQGKRAAAKGSARDNSSLPTTVIAQRVVSPRMLTEEEQATRMSELLAAASAAASARHRPDNTFHFFSFQVAHKTGYMGHS